MRNADTQPVWFYSRCHERPCLVSAHTGSFFRFFFLFISIFVFWFRSFAPFWLIKLDGMVWSGGYRVNTSQSAVHTHKTQNGKIMRYRYRRRLRIARAERNAPGEQSHTHIIFFLSYSGILGWISLDVRDGPGEDVPACRIFTHARISIFLFFSLSNYASGANIPDTSMHEINMFYLRAFDLKGPFSIGWRAC